MAKSKTSQFKRRKHRYKRFKKARSNVQRGRSWLSDVLLVRWYRKALIPFFEGNVPTTTAEYEEQLATFFGVDYREIYHAQVTKPFKMQGNVWLGEHPASVSPKLGKRDMWPSQRLLIRFDRRDEGTKVDVEVIVNKDVNHTFTLTEQEWHAIRDNIRIIVPLYSRGRKRENLELIKEHHARSIRVGLGPDVKIKYTYKR